MSNHKANKPGPSVDPPSLPNKGGQLENTWSNTMHFGQKQYSVGERCTVDIFMTVFSLWQFDVLMTERIIQIFIKIKDYFSFFWNYNKTEQPPQMF